jgi:Domain of unknown function (DUF4136)
MKETKMKNTMKNGIIAIAAALLLTSTAAFAQKTNVDWDRKADFSTYKTYAWQASTHPAPGLWDQRVIDSIDKQLAAKGLQKVTSNPDVWVVYSNSLTDQKQIVGTGYGMGPGWGWGWGWGPQISTVQYNTYITQQGTLVVELADAKDHELLWRGSATGTLSDNSDKNIKTLNSALQKLFKNYPPKDKN